MTVQIQHYRSYMNKGSCVGHNRIQNVFVNNNSPSIFGGGWGMSNMGFGGIFGGFGHCHEAEKTMQTGFKWAGITSLVGMGLSFLGGLFGIGGQQSVSTQQYSNQNLGYSNQYGNVDQNAQLAEQQKAQKQAKDIANIKALYANEKGLTIIANDDGTYTARYNKTNYTGTYDEVKEQLDQAIKANTGSEA